LYYEAVYTHSLARLTLQKAMGILGPRGGAAEPPANVQTSPGKIEEFPTDSAGSLPESGNKGDR